MCRELIRTALTSAAGQLETSNVPKQLQHRVGLWCIMPWLTGSCGLDVEGSTSFPLMLSEGRKPVGDAALPWGAWHIPTGLLVGFAPRVNTPVSVSWRSQ